MYTGKLYNYSFRETFLQGTRLEEGQKIFILVYKLNYYPLLYDLNKLVYACRWDNFSFVSKLWNCFHLLRFTKNNNISITAYHAQQTPVFSVSDMISRLTTSDYF